MTSGFTSTSYEENFTRREIEILGLIAEGWSNQAIAQKLFLSLKTVKWYNTQVYLKLGATNRIQAVAKARQTGLFDRPDQSGTQEQILPRHNLPEPLTSYIGRTKERHDLARLLKSPSNRLVTIVGAGGIGKTRLALETGREMRADYPDGVWLVDLSPLTNPDLLAQSIVTALGWQGVAGQPPEELLVNALRPKKLLLLLDNCEHLVEACARLVTRLLRSCPDLHFLATSREALGVEGEVLFQLDVLTFPAASHLLTREGIHPYDAVQLLCDRVRRVVPGFEVTAENTLPIAKICQRLAGVPLALELAAVHANQLSLPKMAELLENRLWDLTTSPGVQFSRHPSLQACLDWSYTLLSESERVLFRRLAVFSGGWTLEAAEAVAGGKVASLKVNDSTTFTPSNLEPTTVPNFQPANVLDLQPATIHANLVQKSLVVADLSQPEQPRYRFHEIVRQYATEKLAQSGEIDQVGMRHLSYFLDFLKPIAQKFASSEKLKLILLCNLELDNFRKALTFAYEQSKPEFAEAGLRLATSLMLIWRVNCFFAEEHGWVAKGIDLLGDRLKQDPCLYAVVLNSLGYTAAHLNLEVDFIPFLEESIRQWRICQNNDDLIGALIELGNMRLLRGDPLQAKPFYDEAMQLARQGTNEWLLAETQFWQGHLAFLTGDLPQAKIYYQQGLAYWIKTDDQFEACYPTIFLSVIACKQDDLELARSYLEKYLLHTRNSPDKIIDLLTCEYVALVIYSLDDFDLLETYFQEKLSIFTNQNNDLYRFFALRMLGLAARRKLDDYRAMAYYLEAFEASHQRQDLSSMADALAGLGGIAAWVGQIQPAAYLMGAAQAALEKYRQETYQPSEQAAQNPNGRWAFEVEQREFERDLAHLQEQLDPESFAAAWVKGRSMSMDRAILEAYRIKPEVRCT